MKTYVHPETYIQMFIGAIIHNNQKVETSQMFINGRMDNKLWYMQWNISQPQKNE